jgi:hypothetical protein
MMQKFGHVFMGIVVIVLLGFYSVFTKSLSPPHDSKVSALQSANEATSSTEQFFSRFGTLRKGDRTVNGEIWELAYSESQDKMATVPLVFNQESFCLNNAFHAPCGEFSLIPGTKVGIEGIRINEGVLVRVLTVNPIPELE